MMTIGEFNGQLRDTMETPYGVASIEVGREGTVTNVSVSDREARLLMKTRYERGVLQPEWKAETMSNGHRKPATWGYSAPKKGRRDMQTVVDALTLAWLTKHEADVIKSKVACLRARAWRMALSSNEYAQHARILAAEADKLEQPVETQSQAA